MASSFATRGAAGADHVEGDWRRRLSWSIWCTDLVALILGVFGAQLLWFSSLNTAVAPRAGGGYEPVIGYLTVSTVLVAAWMWALALRDSRSMRVLGSDWSEYRRVVDATVRVFGLLAIIALVFKLDLARGYVLISLPAGLVLLLGGRWMWRHWLLRQRRRGAYSRRVVLVGSPESVAQVAADLLRFPGAGYLVVGACVPGAGGAAPDGFEVPVLGGFDTVPEAMALVGADTVIVTGSDDLPAAKVKELSWRLESGRQHLVLSPAIADIAGPRIHTRPVAGLPFVHVETPRFTTGQMVTKRVLDLVLSIGAVIVLSPLLAAVAIAVRATSAGPAIFAQTRVGRDGRTFRMYKFRSMVAGAEAMLPALRERLGDGPRDSGNIVLFKLRDDPRVTPLGAWIRRFSIDELPQLFNVIRGDMSLVGPRPPLRSEVEQYAEPVHRRFLVKPGITGLWQVSGRSKLSWDASVRLDLSYVENYSIVGDLIILAKTARAVVLPGDQAW